MGILTDLIQRNRWEELDEWLASGASTSDSLLLLTEMNRIDRLGRNPLHYACAKKRAPAHIVKLMLDRASSSSSLTKDTGRYHNRTPPPLIRNDICGNTLLHAAAACGNAQVVRVLVEKYDDCGTSIRQVNDVGMTPLMMAWRKYLDASFTLFGDGRSGGRMAPEIFENMETLLKCTSLLDLKSMERLRDLWEKTYYLTIAARATYHHAGRDNQGRLLHTLIAVGGRRQCQCPTAAVWLAIRFYHEQLEQKDEEGNLPLHLAALHPTLPIIPLFMDELEPLTSQVNVSVVSHLVKAHPVAASVVNRQGQLPLHLAIEHGKPWEGALLPLLLAAPQAMDQRDTKTKLFPVLQAASTRSCSLSTVFELLRCRPDILMLSQLVEEKDGMDVG